MHERHVEALEEELAQDVAEFKRRLIASSPPDGPPDLQQKVGEYAARRKAELGLFICARA